MGSTGPESDAEVARADFPDGSSASPPPPTRKKNSIATSFLFQTEKHTYGFFAVYIEGARMEGGKGDSIWDVFAENKEHILDGSHGLGENGLGDDLPTFSEKDKKFIRNKIDFVGINHYTSRFIAHHQDPEDIYFYCIQQVERIEKCNTGEQIGERAASEWLFIVPWGLWKLLNYVAKIYGNPVIYVTENGMVQMFVDTLHGHFWTNFVWAVGYTKRFGIVYVDYKNGLSGHPKASAWWFSHFLKGEEAENKSNMN
ncbi:hypothetical protein GUJ93_ZPchr0007g4525 [Zizania palustris]|uniref:Uncharacterized protein n=1 Tax=Zizania palustris TaxID=103762 RepID=A0A8J5SLQ1_ZIZPA|nr:hypothetical protein GUJ93_ZPchr0007g4525 [Zizania palustris]